MPFGCESAESLLHTKNIIKNDQEGSKRNSREGIVQWATQVSRSNKNNIV